MGHRESGVCGQNERTTLKLFQIVGSQLTHLPQNCDSEREGMFCRKAPTPPLLPSLSQGACGRSEVPLVGGDVTTSEL